jgi:hypothetical protein
MLNIRCGLASLLCDNFDLLDFGLKDNLGLPLCYAPVLTVNLAGVVVDKSLVTGYRNEIKYPKASFIWSNPCVLSGRDVPSL